MEPLSELDLKYFHIKYEHDENVIPIYHNIPLYSHYDEAILHMKKDKENLHMWLDDLRNSLDDFNMEATQANLDINDKINTKIHEAGLDENNPNQIQDIKEVNRLTRQFLKIEIFKADDVYKAAHEFNNSMQAYLIFCGRLVSNFLAWCKGQ